MRMTKEQRRAAAQPLSYEHNSETIPDVRSKLPDHLSHRGEILFPNCYTVHIDLGTPADNQDRRPDGGTIFDLERTPPISPSKHRKKRAAQWRRWDQEIIPLLIPHYSWVLWETKCLRELEKLGTPAQDCDCVPRIQIVTIMRFSSVEDMEVPPSLAVDLRVLEFAFKLFLNVAPNHTVFSTTLETVLSTMGYQLNRQNTLRRRFGNALTWYGHLRNRSKAYYRAALEKMRTIPPHRWCHRMNRRLPVRIVAHLLQDRRRQRCRTPTTRRAVVPVLGCHRGPHPALNVGHLPILLASASAGVLHAPTARIRLSQTRCHVAAQANTFAVGVLCVSATCITIHRSCQSVQPQASDPPRRHPSTHFVPEADAKATDAYVKETRGTFGPAEPRSKKSKTRTPSSAEDTEDGLPDEKRVKASTDFFDDTGLMALLCRHDRVLWLVNMQTRGEQQYYVFVLLETLFQHLPRDITLGILYDIACTLERSCRKWGFLSRFMDRIQFAVSVFHAFGHDWPCQLLYHPRKRTGFGLSDGEGCERFWHLISHLIAVLRISGKWQRLYISSDWEIGFVDGLCTAWKKRQEAESVLAECRVRILALREQWQLQVVAQTKPLPLTIPGRSKNKGQQAINTILLLRSAVKKQADHVNRLRAKFLAAAEDADEEADYYQVEFDKADAARAKAEKTLREKERALGVGERRALNKMSHIQYYNARMNARATKRRLRQRKFELDLVERSFRRLVNEQKLYSHTEAAVKRREKGIQNLALEYNKQCAKVAQLIRNKNAPRGALAPRPIPDGQLWKLDVDNDIWEDVSLDDDETEEQTTPPPWLCDDGVRAGIKALLQIDRCREEDIRLKKERAALQVWFAEEWALVNHALEEAGTAPDRYQYELMRDDLVHLCATWQKSLPDCGLDTSTLPPWGPNATQLARARLDTRRAARGEDRHYNIDEEDFSDEEEGYESGGENEVFSMLDTLATAERLSGGGCGQRG
ncbi:hypothetical protein B0H14DRAFT_3695455 [Mycena olivaceomarginata]|nr:hypothetical protein B0H14DRAFT_3695455 [Mycena olivaceomarginata]